MRTGLAIALLVGLVAFGTPAVAQEGLTLEGLTFRTDVTTSFGTQIQDCYQVDVVSPGSLAIDALGETLTYAKEDLNLSLSGWQASSFSAGLLGIAFHGTFQTPFIIGNGINQNGDTFVLAGTVDENCTLPVAISTAESTANPYSSK